MSNFLRRLPLSRLLLLCGAIVAVGAGATALALARRRRARRRRRSRSPMPSTTRSRRRNRSQGVSARIQFTNHLIEGASLASGRAAASRSPRAPCSPAPQGDCGSPATAARAWNCSPKRAIPQILYDGHTVSLYDASSNTPLPLYAAGQQRVQRRRAPGDGHRATGTQIPTVAEIQEAIAQAMRTREPLRRDPTDVAGQAAYTVRISPRHNGGLIGGAELAWDAVHGVPLRARRLLDASSSPVLELAATEVSYGASRTRSSPSLAADAKVRSNLRARAQRAARPPSERSHTSGLRGAGRSPFTLDARRRSRDARNEVRRTAERPRTALSHTARASAGSRCSRARPRPAASELRSSGLAAPEGAAEGDSLHGASATELPTALGTLLSFERAGVRYLLAGSVTPAASRTPRGPVDVSEPTAPPPVKARGLVKRYKEVLAVDHIDLNVERGRRVRLPRTQRRGQDDDAADGLGLIIADRGHGRAVRARPDARGRARAGGSRRASWRRRASTPT